MTAATPEACEDAMIFVHGSLSVGPAHSTDPREAAELEEQFFQRISEQARLLAATGWTASMVKAATRGLAASPDLDEKIRYGRPIIAGDFERVRRSGLTERRLRDEADGLEVERVIVTRSGFALQVARARLYGYREAMGLWQAAGEPGHFSTDGGRYDDGMFEAVRVEGQEKPLWRMTA